VFTLELGVAQTFYFPIIQTRIEAEEDSCMVKEMCSKQCARSKCMHKVGVESIVATKSIVVAIFTALFST
jgi:hypothetical protein